MANKFVWSGATGGADGSTWADAYTSLMRDWGAEGTFTPATDYIYVRSVHSETLSTTLTIKGSTVEGTVAPCQVICVVGDTTGTTPGNLATGAAVNTDNTAADIAIDEGLYIYGVNFLSNDDILVAVVAADCDVALENCRLELIGTTASDNIELGSSNAGITNKILLTNVIFDFGINSQGLTLRHSNIVCIGGSVATDVANFIENPALGAGTVVFKGVDLSALTSRAVSNGAAGVNIGRLVILSRCLLASGATIVAGTIDIPGFRVESYHCQIGTDADPAYQMEIHDSRGKIVTDTARYRTGGGKDSVRTTPISWDFDTTVGSVRGYPGHALEGPPITAWTDGDGSTAHTYRIYFASDATIQDDELWMELEGPNDAATNSMAVIKTNRVAPLTSAANHTTDAGSSWTGTGVGTKQYLEVAYTPDKPGPVTVRIFMAKASDNVYIDPQIQIDP